MKPEVTMIKPGNCPLCAGDAQLTQPSVFWVNQSTWTERIYRFFRAKLTIEKRTLGSKVLSSSLPLAYSSHHFVSLFFNVLVFFSFLTFFFPNFVFGFPLNSVKQTKNQLKCNLFVSHLAQFKFPGGCERNDFFAKLTSLTGNEISLP